MPQFQIKIDRLAGEGQGVGRKEGKAAFVPYTLPGETAKARPVLDKKSFSRWIPVSIESPSQERVKPKCPVYFQPGGDKYWCGGCDWQHIKPSFQRQAKEALLREALERIGGLKDIPMKPILASPSNWRFRNKVQVPVRQKGKRLLAGFFAPGSHRIVEFDDCVIQPELSVEILNFVLAFARKNKWQGYDEDRRRGWLRHIMVRTNQRGQALLVLVTQTEEFLGKNNFLKAIRKAFPGLIGVHQNIQNRPTNVILGPRWLRVWGRQHLTEKICGQIFQYSPGSFFQVNTGAAEKLYEEALGELGHSKENIVLDLYCGVGAMALIAAKKAKFVLGADVVPSSIRDANANAAQNKIKDVQFVEAPAEDLFSKRPFQWIKKETERLLVLLDPPRTGCDPKLIQNLLALKPKKIVYVSCNPATLARDLKMLSSAYRLTSIRPCDMFPQTSHIEAVASLEKIV